MKLLIRYTIYSVIIVVLLLLALDVYRFHPEAQFAFIFPGIFLLAFSSIMDDAMKGISSRLRLGRR
ncbi:hypothetical protein DYU05_17900 [Mucilaginibacter terrenus]|uniref:Uncharacterized protein n=1 Tax=Mucilaginibacter terrenus TaxID=2482727 RepID=A0A3E2NL38_9SPHI|nr:hypothetical protein [Mucilaginibacter terrenus]RFZ81698.1 hypothetical protein DYU05_17900 [Mucilaginibacter terrenus]